MDVMLPSGLILRHLSVCASDGSAWVVCPCRLRVDHNNVPVGVGENAVWDTVVEFKDKKTRDRFCIAVLNALRADHPEAFGRPAKGSAQETAAAT
jgi:hypothetical protein